MTRSEAERSEDLRAIRRLARKLGPLLAELSPSTAVTADPDSGRIMFGPRRNLRRWRVTGLDHMPRNLTLWVGENGMLILGYRDYPRTGRYTEWTWACPQNRDAVAMRRLRAALERMEVGLEARKTVRSSV